MLNAFFKIIEKNHSISMKFKTFGLSHNSVKYMNRRKLILESQKEITEVWWGDERSESNKLPG